MRTRKSLAERIKEYEALPPEPIVIPSADRQLGYWVGEYIFFKYLPTISSDMMHTRNVIQVSEEDTAECVRLEKIWWDAINDPKNKKNGRGVAPKEWNALLTYRKFLQEKYMPALLECHLHKIYPTDIEEFKTGLAVSLWDCDCCSYHTDSDKITITDDGRFTVITLQLDNTFKLEKED